MCTTARCWTATDDEWDFAFDLNVRSMDRTIKAALPGMLKKSEGLDHQHRVGRLVGARHPVPLRLRHHEAAVVGLTKSVAADFIRRASA